MRVIIASAEGSRESGIELLVLQPGRRFGVIATAGAEMAEAVPSLVRDAREGDRDAFSRLYDRYARMVHGLLLARTSGRDVEDLVQDVFIQAWKELPRLRDDAAFGGWLCAIARRRAIDRHRRSRPTVELPGDLAVDGGAEQAAQARQALEALRSLPDAYRETLMLRLVEGLTGPEIADRTGLTPASVRVNLHRGMKLLRERLHAKEVR